MGWSFAVTALHDETLLSAISDEALNRNFVEFGSLELSNIVWAVVTLDVAHLSFMQAISAAVASVVLVASPQSVSNIGWAFATLRLADLPLFELIATSVKARAHHFDPQALANTTWAFAQLTFEDDHLVELMSEAALNKLKSFRSSELATLAWSISRLRCAEGRLLEAIAEEATGRIKLHAFDGRSVGLLLEALSLRKQSSLALQLLEILDQMKDPISPAVMCGFGALMQRFELAGDILSELRVLKSLASLRFTGLATASFGDAVDRMAALRLAKSEGRPEQTALRCFTQDKLH